MDVNKVYKTQILQDYCHLGLPLRNGRPIQAEVLLGDVGWQSPRDSSFHVLFNAIDPTLHPELPAPEDYDPFPITPSATPARWNALYHFDPAALSTVPIKSTSITEVAWNTSVSTPGGPSAALKATCAKNQGALLMLHHPADHEYLEHSAEIQAYALRNYQIWYSHAAKLGLPLKTGDLVLVTDLYKTAKWDTFTFTRQFHDVQLSLKGTIADVGLSSQFSMTSATSSGVHQLYGPGPVRPGAVAATGGTFPSMHNPDPSREVARHRVQKKDTTLPPSQPEPPLLANQCLFIQGFKPYKSRLFPARMRAAAGPHDLGRPPPRSAPSSPVLAASEGEPCESDIELLAEAERPYDPLIDLLEYALEQSPEADVAIAHHRDLATLFPTSALSDGWPDDMSAYLRQQSFRLNHVAVPGLSVQAVEFELAGNATHLATAESAGNGPRDASVTFKADSVVPDTLASTKSHRVSCDSGSSDDEDDRKWYTVQPDTAGTIKIYAGAKALVRNGTLFRLSGPPPADKISGKYLGHARVIHVEQDFCVANVDPALRISAASVRAQIKSLLVAPRYAVRTAPPAGDTAADTMRDKLDARLKATPTTWNAAARVDEHDSPDVVLEASDAGVRVTIHTAKPLQALGIPPALVPEDELPLVFPATLGALARFHSVLALENPAEPYWKDVRVTLNSLPRTGDDAYDDEELLSPGRARVFPEPHGEAIVAPVPEELYALVLRSNAPTPLFPHVLSMNPATLAVTLLCEPKQAGNAPLLPGGTVRSGGLLPR